MDIAEIQSKLQKDLNEGKLVWIRTGEVLRSKDGSTWRIFENGDEEQLDERDVRSFLKIAANFYRKYPRKEG